MRGRIMFVAGLAIGYVLGAKAGRERYEQIAGAARKVRSSSTIQEATGLVQAQTTRLVSTGREAVRGRMHNRFADTRFGSSRIGQRLLGEPDDDLILEDRPPRTTGQGF